jgi:hypothetical protein
MRQVTALARRRGKFETCGERWPNWQEALPSEEDSAGSNPFSIGAGADHDRADREQRAGGHEEEHAAQMAMIEKLAEDGRRHDACDV